MYIIPQPQKWTKLEGNFVLSYEKRIVLEDTCTSEIYDYVKILQAELQQALGYELAVVKGKSRKAGIILRVRDSEWKEREYYTISIKETGIVITGRGNEGVLYGIQTLRQILRQSGAVIPYMEIEDFPRISNRGFYHDVTRGRIPTVEFLKRLADKAAFYKMNQLQLYVEHTYLFEEISELWRDSTPLKAEDILELDAYCQKLNIDLVPSLSSFGHLYHLLRTKKYRELCELEGVAEEPFGFIDRMHHHTIDVFNPKSLELMWKLMDEYMSLFSSKYYNICADETFDLGKGRNRNKVEEIGEKKVYISFVKKLCEHLVDKGKIPMFWGDIIVSKPEYVHELPQETICLNWNYEPDVGDSAAKAFSSAGVKQYMCPGIQGWNHLIPEIAISYENIKQMCIYAAEYNAEGVLNTDWGDFGTINHPEFGIVGMIYGAAFSWNTEIPEFEEINRQISKVEFKDDSEELVKILVSVSEAWVFGWYQAIYYKEKKMFWVSAEKFADISQRMRCFDKIRNQLYEKISMLAESTRSILKAYLIALRGLELLQYIGAFICEEETGRKLSIEKNSWETAADLEIWFMDYKELWRSVSKESELYQIQQVINWYADWLRDKK